MRLNQRGLKNAYVFAMFAACREIRLQSKYEIYLACLDESRSVSTEVEKSIANFIFCYGCAPGFGILANTKFVNDLIMLFTRSFDDSGVLLLPDCFQQVVSSDAVFETSTSNLS